MRQMEGPCKQEQEGKVGIGELWSQVLGWGFQREREDEGCPLFVFLSSAACEGQKQGSGQAGIHPHGWG